jgi:purine catabolism regulator
MATNQASGDVYVSDLLRLALPLQTAVIAGSQHNKRNIDWVVILPNWQNLDEQIQAGDFVILPPTVQATIRPASLSKGIQTLANLSAAGLLVFTDIPNDAIITAQKYNFPILKTPSDETVRAVHRSIAALLVDRQTAINERSMELYRKLSEMSREGKGLSEMTEVMANLTGKIVIIQDKRLEVRAMSVPSNNELDIARLLEVLVNRDQLPPVLRNRKAAARAHQSYWQQLLPIENIGRLVSPIISGDRARGYLSLVGPADQLDLMDSLTVEHGAAACALEMAKAKAISEAKKALRGDFLEGLLAETLNPREIERLESRLDHDTTLPHAVMTFKWLGNSPENPSLRRMETTINWLLTNHSRPALVHIFGDKHVVVFQSLKSSSDVDTAQDFARRLREQLAAEFPKSTLLAGLSGPVTKLTDWPKVYREAVQAMQLGERLNLNHLVVFNSLGVYRLLGQLEDNPAVQEFTDQVIGPLVQYDEQHRSSLVQTLDAYFDHHGNISQTAESLYIHRNTLLYRLERIQELTGHDLNQANMRLALHLALKLWQLRPPKN